MRHYVYTLSDPIDGKVFYVGKGTNGRMRSHILKAVNGNHPNPNLQKKILNILDTGREVVTTKTAEFEDEDECFDAERQQIAFHGLENLCNRTSGGEGYLGVVRYWLGKKMSPEHVARIVAAKTGRKDSQETRSRKSEAHKGKGQPWLRTEEVRVKMAKTKRGQILSREHKDNIANALKGEKAFWFGKTHSEESKARMSVSARARAAKTATIGCVIWLSIASTSKGYLLVEDIPQLTTNIFNEAKNYAAYLQQETNQLTQIEQGVSSLENQATALLRFGNPQTYVNMLGLGQFMASSAALVGGVGQTISSYRQAANGIMALGYTANGIYSNLNGMVDRFGNPVRFDTNAFRKFSAVNDMLESYTSQQQVYNAQMTSLQQQLTTAMNNLNRASTQMETEKYSAQINGIHAQINALGHTSQLTGQRIQAQAISNQNDAARTQEATRQQELQERQTDLQNEATDLGRFIGGGTQN